MACRFFGIIMVLLIGAGLLTGCAKEHKQTPPEATITTPTGLQGGDITIECTLRDAQADLCSVEVKFSEDGGTTWRPAILVSASQGQITGNIISGVWASSTETDFAFVWNSLANIGTSYQTDIRIQVTPSDLPGYIGKSVSTDDFTVNYNETPAAAITDPTGSQSGDVTMDFTLSDTEGDTCSIDVDFSADGGVTWSPATLLSTSGGGISGNMITGLVTAPTAVSYSFIWDSVTDAGTDYQTDICIRITPHDGRAYGDAAVTGNFTVNYNDGPVVILSDPAGVQAGLVTIDYTLADNQGDVCSVRVDVSQDGGTSYAPATISGTSGGSVSNNVISGLAASDTPTDYSFTWDSTTDIGSGRQTDIRIRIIPNDGTDDGAAVETGDFEVNYNNLPVATVATPAGVQGGNVNVIFTLTDQDGDTCRVTVYFSEDAGGTWAGATLLSSSFGTIANSAISGLPVGPAPATYSFVWDSVTDIGTTYQTDIQLKVLPNDGTIDGAAVATDDFEVNRNNAPAITVTDPVGVQSGNVTIDFTLADPDGDTCSVVTEYSIDGGATWSRAMVVSASAGTVSGGTVLGLSAASTPTPYSLVWDSTADIGRTYQTGIQVRLTPYDGTGAGTADATASFTVDNNSPPSANVQNPTTAQAGDTRITFTLADGESNLCQVTVEYSTDGGATWSDATIKTSDAGTISGNVILGLASAPSGIWYSLVWDTFIDGIALMDVNYGVRIRITANDGLEDGTPDATANFIVDNTIAGKWLFPAENATSNATDSRKPAVAVDSAGVVHVVWSDNSDGDYDIWYRNFNGTVWSTSVNISNSVTAAEKPSIAVDSGDDLHVAWQDILPGNYDIYYSTSNDGGSSWTGSARIANTTGASINPDIAVGRDPDIGGEGIYVVWQDDTTGDYDVYFIRNIGFGWQSLTNLSNNDGDSETPVIAITGNRHRHVAWSDDTSGSWEILYSTFSNRMGAWMWQWIHNITNNGMTSLQPKITTAPGNVPAVVWMDDQSGGNYDIFYRICTHSTNFWQWSGQQRVASTSGMSLYPDLVLTLGGDVRVVWQDDTSGTYEVYYSGRPPSTSRWSAAVNISNTSGASEYPRLAIDGSAGLHLVWQDNTSGNMEAYYSNR
jgi:hypothetical protein